MMSIMAQAVVRERERGTLEQMFVTPITPRRVPGRQDDAVRRSSRSVQIIVVAAGRPVLVPRAVQRSASRVVLLGLLLFMLTAHRPRAARLAGVAHAAAGAADGHVHPDPVDGAVRLHLPDRVDARRRSCRSPTSSRCATRSRPARRRSSRAAGSSALAVPLLAMAVFSVVIFGIAVARFRKRLGGLGDG